MTKGVIYVMTTAVSGLLKIGKTQNKQFQERMRYLESNGYGNVTGLKRAFAIEVDDYDDKEKLIHDVFSKHRVGETELFALELDLVRQLLLAFEGKVIFPTDVNKEQQFGAVSRIRTANSLFSFYRKGLKNGDQITFRYNKAIMTTIVGEREVEYLGDIYKLSPLTRKLMEQIGKANKSGAYQGAQYWYYNDIRLVDMNEVEP